MENDQFRFEKRSIVIVPVVHMALPLPLRTQHPPTHNDIDGCFVVKSFPFIHIEWEVMRERMENFQLAGKVWQRTKEARDMLRDLPEMGTEPPTQTTCCCQGIGLSNTRWPAMGETLIYWHSSSGVGRAPLLILKNDAQ